MARKMLINQIIPFSNVDGDGNRCSIFVQGCNINCLYCHNSETIQICRNCGICIKSCPVDALTSIDNEVQYNKEICINCDKCISVCPYQSTPKAIEYELEEIVSLIRTYKPYIRGITISGGEPTLYSDFLIELFIEVKKMGLSCYLDVNGFFDYNNIIELINLTDGFLFDVKAYNNQVKICGVKSVNPINNLKKLLELNKIVEVRTVLLKDFVDCEKTVIEVSRILCDYDEVPYRLIKAHCKGLKPEQVDKISSYIPDDDYLIKLKKLALKEGFKRIKIND